MGRNAWESDAELGRSGRSTRWGRIFVWILVVGAATFALAYYLPLHRTHRALIQQQRELTETGKAFEQEIRTTKQQLDAAVKKRDELEAERSLRDRSQKAAADRSDQIRKTLSAKLGNQAGIAIGATNGRVLVAIASDVLFAAKKQELSAGGRALLCELAAAGETHPIRVGAVTDEAAPAGRSSSAWDSSAARAATVARSLEEQCRVAHARLTAIGYGRERASSPAFAGAKVSGNRIEIEIDVGAGASAR
jgi:flagellar motor protein MotB